VQGKPSCWPRTKKSSRLMAAISGRMTSMILSSYGCRTNGWAHEGSGQLCGMAQQFHEREPVLVRGRGELDHAVPARPRAAPGILRGPRAPPADQRRVGVAVGIEAGLGQHPRAPRCRSAMAAGLRPRAQGGQHRDRGVRPGEVVELLARHHDRGDPRGDPGRTSWPLMAVRDQVRSPARCDTVRSVRTA